MLLLLTYLKCTGNSSGVITLIPFQPIVEKPVNIHERRITFLAVLSTPHIKKVLKADTTIETAKHKQLHDHYLCTIIA